MRVSNFADWIDETIFNEVMPGQRNYLSEIKQNFDDLEILQRTDSGASGLRGEDVLHPAWRPDTGLVTVRNPRKALIDGILLIVIDSLKWLQFNEIMIYFPIKGFLQNGGRECNEFLRVDLQKQSCSKGLCESKGTTTIPTTAPVPVNPGKERGKKNKL